MSETNFSCMVVEVKPSLQFFATEKQSGKMVPDMKADLSL